MDQKPWVFSHFLTQIDFLAINGFLDLISFPKIVHNIAVNMVQKFAMPL